MTSYEHFNNLNPAQHELLTKLAEEASEVVQAVCKALLHGLDSTEPGHALCNREKIENELGDLLFFMNQAIGHGLLDQKKIERAILRRGKRTNHYLHHVEID